MWSSRRCGLLRSAIGKQAVGGVPDDEYDCLIGPIINRLTAAATTDTLPERLAGYTEDHFGLQPVDSRERALAQVLVDAWTEVR